MSTMTHKYKKLSILTFLLSAICSLCPILIYVIKAFVDKDVQEVNKYTLGIMCSLALIVTLINIVSKLHLKQQSTLLEMKKLY